MAEQFTCRVRIIQLIKLIKSHIHVATNNITIRSNLPKLALTDSAADLKKPRSQRMTKMFSIINMIKEVFPIVVKSPSQDYKHPPDFLLHGDVTSNHLKSSSVVVKEIAENMTCKKKKNLK